VNRPVRQPDNSECGYGDCQKNKLHFHFFASLTGNVGSDILTPSPFLRRRLGCPSHFSPIASRQARWRSAKRRAAFFGEHRHAVFKPLGLAHEDAPFEIDIFYPQPQAFQQPQPGAILLSHGRST
jgi:hypothetical protein